MKGVLSMKKYTLREAEKVVEYKKELEQERMGIKKFMNQQRRLFDILYFDPHGDKVTLPLSKDVMFEMVSVFYKRLDFINKELREME
jgi:hypothetical protein